MGGEERVVADGEAGEARGDESGDGGAGGGASQLGERVGDRSMLKTLLQFSNPLSVKALYPPTRLKLFLKQLLKK